ASRAERRAVSSAICSSTSCTPGPAGYGRPPSAPCTPSPPDPAAPCTPSPPDPAAPSARSGPSGPPASSSWRSRARLARTEGRGGAGGGDRGGGGGREGAGAGGGAVGPGVRAPEAPGARQAPPGEPEGRDEEEPRRRCLPDQHGEQGPAGEEPGLHRPVRPGD